MAGNTQFTIDVSPRDLQAEAGRLRRRITPSRFLSTVQPQSLKACNTDNRSPKSCLSIIGTNF